MKIIIPMAGEGKRFRNIGFNIPKFMILANKKTLFKWSMLSLNDFFGHEFIFITRKLDDASQFIQNECKELKINNYRIIEVSDVTKGQASTVFLANDIVNDDDQIVIYNIDTYVEEGNLLCHKIQENMDGFIPSFRITGNQWSFVKMEGTDSNKIIEVSEKIRISDYATLGLYYFKSWSIFKQIFLDHIDEVIRDYGESYVAPMYQYLINEGKNVKTCVIETSKIHVLGTPNDIVEFCPTFLDENNVVHQLG